MSVAAAIAGGLVSSAAQLYANQQNIKANDKRFGAEVELANTAHRREIEDLQAAGLNPILSASGSGASVPQLGAAQVDSIGDKLGDSIQSAGRLAALEIPLKESQVALNSAQAENLRNDGVLKRVQADMIARGDGSLSSSAASIRDASESFGDRVGKWFADKFGSKPITPSPTRRSINDRLLKDDMEWNKAVELHRSLGFPNRVRTKRRK